MEFVINNLVKKKRSTEVTKLFESYRTTSHLKESTQRVWFTEKENHRKRGMLCIGHTKCYIKVTVPFDETLLGKCALMQITECFRWHVEGEILEKDLCPEKVDEKYFEEDKKWVKEKMQSYQKKPKKLSDQTKEKLKELIDLDEESEPESEPESRDSEPESRESESKKAEVSDSETKMEKKEEEEVKLIEKDAPIKKKKEDSNSIVSDEFKDTLNIYKQATIRMGQLSTIEYATLILLFLGGMLHIFGI